MLEIRNPIPDMKNDFVGLLLGWPKCLFGKRFWKNLNDLLGQSNSRLSSTEEKKPMTLKTDQFLKLKHNRGKTKQNRLPVNCGTISNYLIHV